MGESCSRNRAELLHLPAMRTCFEETARRAEKETLSYEQYLLELTERECEERRRNRIRKLLRESELPLEKSLAIDRRWLHRPPGDPVRRTVHTDQPGSAHHHGLC